jgi:polyphenol oxidase
MNNFDIVDNILKPAVMAKFNEIICGFTLPVYGNMALTRKSYYSGKSTEENRKLLAMHINIDIQRFFSPHQVHSDNIIYVNEKDAGKGSVSLANAIDGDACITDKKNILLLVTWADCIPVILYDCEKKIICAIHAGWKGTNLQIIEKSLKYMNDLGSLKKNINVAIGPGIRDCCYEVGIEFKSYFEEYKDLLREAEEGLFFDLSGCIFRKFIERGISEKNIAFYSKCNSCSDKPAFFSCRKDGKDKFEGQAAYICLI